MSFHDLREQAKGHREQALHRARGGSVSDEAEDRKEVAAGVHAHERHLHKGEKETKLKRGGSVEGAAPAKRLDRYAHGGRTKHKATTVNVVVAPGGGQGAPQAVPVPHPVPVPVASPGMPPRPMPGPGAGPMPMPGGLSGAGPMPPGGPPGMPMRARGGAVKMTAGAESGMGRLEKARMVE